MANMANTKRAFPSLISNAVRNAGLYIVMLGIVLFFSFKSKYFLTFDNIMNMLIAVSVIGILSPTMTMALICRGADLTSGAIMALSACLSTLLVENYGIPWY